MLKFLLCSFLILLFKSVYASEWVPFTVDVNTDDFSDEKSVYIGTKEATDYRPVMFGVVCHKNRESVMILEQDYSSSHSIDVKYRFDSLEPSSSSGLTSKGSVLIFDQQSIQKIKAGLRNNSQFRIKAGSNSTLDIPLVNSATSMKLYDEECQKIRNN